MTEKTRIKEIFVSEISFETSEDELRQLFSTCGTVKNVSMLNDARGQFKGIAFVKMSSDKETREALNMLDGTLLQNRRIKVAPARPKTQLQQTPVEELPPQQRNKRRRIPKGRKKVR